MHAPSPSNAAPLRIALVAPPMKSVPPVGYGGTERVVAALAEGLHARGHELTVFATGDSHVPGRLIPIRDECLWNTGYRGDITAYLQIAAARVWEHAREFDVIHSHIETHGFLLARHSPTPVVTTMHSRLDDAAAGIPELMAEFRDIPLVSISRNQRRWWPDHNWVGTIHHGQDLADAPFHEQPGDYLVVVGRLAREKGIAEAIELARRTSWPLKLAAKAIDPAEKDMERDLVRPAVDEGVIEYVGELEPADRDRLFAGAFATLMLGSWPEPFGLVAIESLATGTPVIARRTGALPEIIEEGVDGFLVDDLGEAQLALGRIAPLDRAEIRRRTLQRFSVERMTEQYEAVYRQLIAGGRRDLTRPTALPTARPAWRDRAKADAHPETTATGTGS